MEQPRQWTSNQASIVERMIHTDAYQLLAERVGWLENRAIQRLTSDNCDIDEVQRLRGKLAALREFHPETIMREVEKVRAANPRSPEGGSDA